MYNKIFQRYTVIPSVVPNNYGNSCSSVLLNRALFLFGIENPQSIRSQFNRNVKDWKEQNQKKLINHPNPQFVLIDLPFRRIKLPTGKNNTYINFHKNLVHIPFHALDKINKRFLITDLLKEVLLTLSINLTKTIYDLYYLNTTDIYINLQWAALLGIVKGLVKAVSDALSAKDISLSNLSWKCISEVFSEIITELTFCFSNITRYVFFQSALKAFWKYLFEQIVGGTYFLMTFTELTIEMFKAGFKAVSRDYFTRLIISYIFYGQIIDSFAAQFLSQFTGSLTGALLAVGLLNVFIEQCTYSNLV